MPIPTLTPDKLRRVCEPASLDFATTAELPPAADIIGQPRGTQAIEFGIDIDRPGYNIFVLGEEGTGRTTAISRFLSERAARRPTPQDWLYVNNFAEPHKPRALNLPAGLGRQLRDDMDALIDHLKRNLPQAFDQEAYANARTQIRVNFEIQRDGLYAGLQARSAARGLTILRAPEGWVIAPVRDGQPLPPEAFDALPAEDKQKIEAARRDVEIELEESLRASHNLEKSAKDAQRTLDQQVAASVVDRWIDELKAKYIDQAETVFYLTEVRRDVVDHVEDFLPAGDKPEGEADPRPNFRKYLANLVVDHSRTQGGPVVVELNPTYAHLFGRIEYEARFGALSTDFSLIRTGALHAANGGYLVLHAHDVYFEPQAWEALKRSLVSGFVHTEDLNGRGGLASTKSLSPEPIPLDLKVVLVGPPHAYYELHEFDDDFGTLFKVKADFAYDMPRSPETELQYARFIAGRCAEEKLRPFDRAAVARVVEFGARAAGDQDKLSVRFGEVADLAREADYWAGQMGQATVTAAAVRRALDEKDHRSDKVAQLQRERILEGSVFIDTQGQVVGQINALTIADMGDYSYGLPARITARTYVGHGGVGHLDRDTGMAGQLHNKGLLTLSSYFNATYAAQRSVSFSGQLTFEQNYGNIEGDSASAAELCALLSSLSGYPLRQSLAITGSVNQKGDIQPIGSVNEKIEGFFDICAARGLTGDQGVIIPATNVRDLMLDEKVVEAVKAGRFQIWAVSRVDEAIELFTGAPAGAAKDGRWPDKTIHHAVQKRLRELAKGHDRDHEDDDDRRPARRPARRKPAPRKPARGKPGVRKRPVRKPVRRRGGGRA
jgi:lon-related putative ATP-dependent protease